MLLLEKSQNMVYIIEKPVVSGNTVMDISPKRETKSKNKEKTR